MTDIAFRSSGFAILAFFLAACGLQAQWLGWDGEELAEESWRQSNGEFRGMLLISPDPGEFLQEWAKAPSGEDPPNLATTQIARRGDATGAFVLFQGCAAGDDGACNAKVDFEITYPDGSSYSRLEDAELWVGKPAIPAPAIQLGANYMIVVIDPDDPLGPYGVHAKVCDRVANRCLELSSSFEAIHRLAEFDLNELIHSYYLDPRPEFISQLIDAASGPEFTAAFQPGGPIEGFLAEIFGANPALVPGWMSAIGQLDEEQQEVFRQALQLSENPEAGIVGAPPSPGQNDLIWGAFFASGDTEYLDALIANTNLAREREDMSRFLCGASAQWSLASNMRHHFLIARHVQARFAAADEGSAAAIRELLETEPEEFREQTIAVLKQQRDAGIW